MEVEVFEFWEASESLGKRLEFESAIWLVEQSSSSVLMEDSKLTRFSVRTELNRT